MPTKRTRQWLLVALVIGGLVVGGLFGSNLLAIAPFSTASVFNMYGTNNQDPDWDARGYYQFKTELLDADQYVASFDPDGSSEQILMAFEMCRFRTDILAAWVIMPSPEGPHWRYDIKLNGAIIDTLYRTSSGPAQGNCPDTYVTSVLGNAVLFGNEKTGKLEVDSYAYMGYCSIAGCTSGQWVRFGYDAARIVSGVGQCVTVTPMPVKPGADIEAQCDLGWATGKSGTGGWSLWLGNPEGTESSTKLAGPMPNNAFDYRVTFKAPNARGIYNIYLLNGMFVQSWYQFTVTVNPELAPPPPTWSVDPNPPYKPGDSVKLSWSAKSSDKTNATIKQVWVEVAYTDGSAIKPRQAYAGATGSLTFSVSKTIDIHVSVVAEDSNGELSGPEQRTLQVEKCDVNNRCQPPPNQFSLPIWLILVLAGAGLILIAVLFPFFTIWPWRVILMLIAVALFAAAYFVFPV